MNHRATGILLALLVVLGAVPLAAGQTAGGGKPGEELVVPDPKGDPAPFGMPGAPASTPENALSDVVDIVNLRVFGEDIDAIQFEAQLVKLKSFSALPFFGNWADYSFYFKLEGSNLQYEIHATIDNRYAQASGTTGQQAIPANFCIRPEGRGCNSQRAIATADWEASKIIVYIPKASLIGRDPVGGGSDLPTTPIIGPGSRLVELRAIARGGGFPNPFTDYVPNAGVAGPYVLGSAAANDRVQLKVNVDEEGADACVPFCFQATSLQDFPRLSVSPGTTSLIQVAVVNNNAGKRIINLSAQFVDPKDDNKWDARIVGTITVPGSSHRIVNLIINATNAVEHRETTLVRVVSKSLGFPDEIGALKIRLVGAVPPSPTRRDLFPHAVPSPNSATSFCFGGNCGARYWMNTLEKDPTATGDSTPIPMIGFGGSATQAEFQLRFPLDAPLVKDLVLDANKTVEGSFVIRSDMPLSGSARLELHGGDILVGSSEVPWTSGTDPKFSFLPGLDATRIAAGNTLMARLVVRAQGANLGFFQTLSAPKVVMAGSKMTLPAIPDPNPKVQQTIPLGPAFITLTPVNETEEFVNPGKVKVFQLTLVNEGIQEDVVSLDAMFEPGNWYVDFKPGSSYRLKPGESVTFGVLVKPPSKVEENEQCHILVNATSSVDPEAIAQVSLTAIATSGVELEDEAENYTTEEEAESAVVETDAGGRSPGPGAFMAVSVLVPALLILRRRRR